MFKHSHFMGHSSTVNCFRFGRKSGQVAVSGGDDTNVNVWRIRENETKNIMSLAGHSSPVECVIFDPAEKRVVAGSTSGAIKAYDMESAKVFRSLKGHMSSCTTIDYHLYGDYVASGALDTNVKIWDLKTKNCVQTFKGHASEVTSVSFTPDGRWLTSGSADGTLKIWDLTAGKLLQEFSDHAGAITCLEFNPEEYILVSASQDRTLRFWDLQSFELLGVTPVDTAPVTAIAHTISEPYSGKYAAAVSQDTVKLWSYDSAITCHDTLLWNKAGETLGDTLVTDNLQLYGGSFANAFVSIWRVDLTALQPFAPAKKTPRPITPAAAPRPFTPKTAPPPTPQPRVATPQSGPTTQAPSPSVPPPTASSPDSGAMQTMATEMGLETIQRFATPERGSTEYVAELKAGMELSLRTFKSRQKALEQFLSGFWDKGDVHGAFRFLGQLPTGTREALAADVLGNVDLAAVGLDLEACVLLLPLALELVAGFPTYAAVGVAVAKVLVAAFGPLVKDNKEARRNNREVNFAGEERAARCDVCHGYFVELQSKLPSVETTDPRALADLKGLLGEYGWGR
ncbi:katanin p80 subunit [Achlya hypogyna]|uniref:Katanin p80 WD40 repeat-containing subunit B1 homolog n=1 Tax=Achlya hypogyna TaxID=1202772 RepID=A0A1V9YPB6_ACHHY|nr:katanin p80 subunit [Achlya hypogyna]